MLKWLHIRDLALVKEAELEFLDGFNAVTGETGAGKSVLLGGLKLLLGGRVDRSAIREGASRCEVSGAFSIAPADLERINVMLDSAGVAPCENGELLVKRVFTPSGGRIFVNDSAANNRLLLTLGGMLADLHGANETSSLMNPAEQTAALDRFAGHRELLDACASAWAGFREAVRAKEALLSGMPSAFEAEKFRSDIAAIRKTDPKEGEDAELEKRHSAAANSKDILETASAAVSALTECDESLLERAAAIRRLIQPLERIDEAAASNFLGAMETICDGIRALSDDLSGYASSVELDESEFNALEDRMRDIQTLKRKFGPAIPDVLSYLDEAERRLDIFENSESALADADRKADLAEAALKAACLKLSAARKKAASELAPLLKQELVKLGFRHAEFDAAFEASKPGPDGSDRVEFLFSANPGVKPMPLREVASSGELCRVMLAMKTVLAGADRIPTLVFDEIDANIGGETAVTVGSELAKLAEHKQIISISHLPQVAACAGRHFQVSKETSTDEAVTTVREVSGKARVREIARMLGGGAAAEKHASAMLSGKGL